jgi:hypothetical protein
MMALIVQACGVVGTLAAATIAVRSYVNSNKRAEEARKRDLETRQAQLFLQLYSKYYDREWVSALQRALYIDFKDFDDWWAKYGPSNPEALQSFDIISHYFEGAGVLVKKGLLDPTMVAELVSEELSDYWEKYGPVIKEYRKRSNKPKAGENQEYLYDLFKTKSLG